MSILTAAGGGGGGGSVGNASTTLQRFAEVAPTANASAHTKGSATTIGTTSSAWSGFHIWFFGAGNASYRFLADVSFDGGATWAVQNLFSVPNQAVQGSGAYYFIQTAVPSGADLRVRCQCSTGGQGVNVLVIGEVAQSTRAPGYSTFTAINVDTANTKAGTQDITMTSASWASIADPTAAAYSAIVAAVDVGTTGPATALWARVTLATGTSGGGSEAEIASFIAAMATASGQPRRHISPVLPVAIPSGVRVSVKATPLVGITDTTSQIRVALYGLR